MLGDFPLILVVDSQLDNSSFYLPAIKQAFPEVAPVVMELDETIISYVQATDMDALPALLMSGELEQTPGVLDWLEQGYLKKSEWGFISTPKFSMANRVLFKRMPEAGKLYFFSQPDCAPCRSMLRLLNQYEVMFEKCNERSLLWHDIQVHKTPAFLWENRYYFEGSQGFKLTPHARILPSERA